MLPNGGKYGRKKNIGGSNEILEKSLNFCMLRYMDEVNKHVRTALREKKLAMRTMKGKYREYTDTN